MRKATIFFTFLFYLSLLSEQASAQDQDELFRPLHKNFAFQIAMNLSSQSENKVTHYLPEMASAHGLFSGLDLAFRYYLSDNFAYRTNISFLNSTSRHQGNFHTLNATSLNEFLWSNGLMYAFKGTNKLEPYAFFDLGFGRTKSSETTSAGMSQTEDSRMFRTIRLVSGLGFNYYFAKNIGVGAELGTGLNVYAIPMVNGRYSRTTQFLSGLGGKIGITVVL